MPNFSLLGATPLRRLLASVVLPVMTSSLLSAATNGGLGLFSSHGDVGAPAIAGTADYDPATGAYTVGASGDNMWFGTDAFHFVWVKVAGDVTLAADVEFLTPTHTPHEHRKAALILRRTLDADSVYADVAVHGDGLTCLQFRDATGAPTRNIESLAKAPRRLQIEKRGAYVMMSLGATGDTMQPASGSLHLELGESFYVGLAVCSHDNAKFEKAVFRNVQLRTGQEVAAGTKLVSSLEVIELGSLNRRVLHCAVDHFEAPNWSPDGTTLIFNRDGRLYRFPVAANVAPAVIDTGFAVKCNNDHGISPDGMQLAISDQSENGRSLVYTLPIAGGRPTRITEKSPSYWHGWSPDGKSLVYCAERDGNYDVYRIAAGGGAETRLTTAEGLDDGPEYSPDGQWIYFNSVRSGKMQIWRMRADGSDQQRVTHDDFNNWFAHPSPDGKSIVFISYGEDVEPGNHPANKDVMLRLLSADGHGEAAVLAHFFGGQGTINVPSWAPDSTKFAFVSYALVP